MEPKRIFRKKITAVLVLFLAAAFYFTNLQYGLLLRSIIGTKLNQWEGKTLNHSFKTKIKSGNLSTDYTIELALKDIERLKLNTVNIPVVVNIQDLSSSTMSLDQSSIQKAKKLIRLLRGKKINIILEPYPWIANGRFYEVDWNPANVEEFFIHWREQVLEPLISQVAIPGRVDALCIASSLDHLESYDSEWSRIAEYVRKNFKGLITYKTNWWYTAHWDTSTGQRYTSKRDNQVFSSVDYISIAAYFELSEKAENSVEELKKDLTSTSVFNRRQNVVEQVRGLSEQWGKPVFFGELGFPRRSFAAMHPWHPSPSETENPSEQARCFRAYQEMLIDDWFLGFSIFAVGNHDPDKNYYPSEESAEVIRGWFAQ